MSEQRIPADRRARRRWAAIWFGVPGLALLASLALRTVDPLDPSAPTDELLAAVDRHFLMSSAVMAAASLCWVSFSVHLALVARAVRRTGQFPPPGHPLPYATVLRSGSAARSWAIVYGAAALAWFAVGAFGLYAAVQVLP